MRHHTKEHYAFCEAFETAESESDGPRESTRTGARVCRQVKPGRGVKVSEGTQLLLCSYVLYCKLSVLYCKIECSLLQNWTLVFFTAKLNSSVLYCEIELYRSLLQNWTQVFFTAKLNSSVLYCKIELKCSLLQNWTQVFFTAKLNSSVLYCKIELKCSLLQNWT